MCPIFACCVTVLCARVPKRFGGQIGTTSPSRATSARCPSIPNRRDNDEGWCWTCWGALVRLFPSNLPPPETRQWTQGIESFPKTVAAFSYLCKNRRHLNTIFTKTPVGYRVAAVLIFIARGRPCAHACPSLLGAPPWRQNRRSQDCEGSRDRVTRAHLLRHDADPSFHALRTISVFQSRPGELLFVTDRAARRNRREEPRDIPRFRYMMGTRNKHARGDTPGRWYVRQPSSKRCAVTNAFVAHVRVRAERCGFRRVSAFSQNSNYTAYLTHVSGGVHTM